MDHYSGVGLDGCECDSEQPLLWAIGAVPLGVLLLDADGRVLHVNEPACELLGCTEQELVGLPATDLVHRDDRGRVGTELELLTAGAIERMRREVRVITPAGVPRRAELDVRRLRALPGDGQLCAVAILEEARHHPRHDEPHRMAQSSTLTDRCNQRPLTTEAGGQAALVAATLIDAITIGNRGPAVQPIAVSGGVASVGEAADATRPAISADRAIHEVRASEAPARAPSAGHRPPRVHVDIRDVLRAVAELGSAGLSLVAWELGTDTITVAPAWSAAVRTRLLERVHYEPRNQEWQYALSRGAYKRLRLMERGGSGP